MKKSMSASKARRSASSVTSSSSIDHQAWKVGSPSGPTSPGSSTPKR